MTRFDPEYFRPFKPTKEEIQGYLRNAERNLSIARQDSFVEVRACFCRDYFCSLGKGRAIHLAECLRSHSCALCVPSFSSV